MRPKALIYALISTFYTTVAIIVLLFIIKNPAISDLVIIFISPFVLFPVTCTFLSGYFSFLLKIKAWLLGFIHYLFAHILIWMGYFLFFVLLKYPDYFIDRRIVESFHNANEIILMSIIGGVWIFPGFALLSYILKKKL